MPLANTIAIQTTGRIAVAITVLAVISIVTLALLYSGLPLFGPINDLTNAVSGIFIALLAWQFHHLLRNRAPGIALPVLLAAWAGAAAIIVNSILVAFGRMAWTTGGMYTAFGYALVGIWILGMLRTIGSQPFLTPGLVRLGLITSVAMLMGFLAGPMLASGFDLRRFPLAGIAYFGAAAGWFLFPVWCWFLGRGLLEI